MPQGQIFWPADVRSFGVTMRPSRRPAGADLSPAAESRAPVHIPTPRRCHNQRAPAAEKLQGAMREASKRLEFEYAAVLRDRIIELRGQ